MVASMTSHARFHCPRKKIQATAPGTAACNSKWRAGRIASSVICVAPAASSHSRLAIFPFQQRAEIFERPVGGRCILTAARITAAPGVVEDLPVLGLVTVGAQQLPVAAVGRVVVVVAVAMMDLE